MPEAYIETAEIDCLHDAGVIYAERLKREGIPVILRETHGTLHGYDMALKSPIVQDCVRDRIHFLNQVLH